MNKYSMIMNGSLIRNVTMNSSLSLFHFTFQYAALACELYGNKVNVKVCLLI